MAVKATLKSSTARSSTIDPETPSGAIIAAATATQTVTTSTGMSITFRRMTAAREMQLSRIFNTAVVNNMFYQWCWFAACIAEINGDPVFFPATEAECLAIVERVGDEGILALQTALAVKK